MMVESDNKEMVDVTVIAQVPELQDGDEVFISALDRKLILKIAAGTSVPSVPDAFIFRLTIPVFSRYQFHLFTCRHSPPTDSGPHSVDRDQAVVEAEPHQKNKATNGIQGRITGAEWCGHLVVATLDWKTVFVTWGRVFSNWMKSPEAPGPEQLTLLMMVRCQKDQRKQRLRLRLLKLTSYDQDDDDDDDDDEGENDGDKGEGGGWAREVSSSEKEFPLGSGCYWIRGPKEIVRNSSKFCLQVTDENKRKSVHHQLNVTWSELPVGKTTFKSRVVCCELLPSAGPFPVPRLCPRATLHSVDDLATDQSSSESHNTLTTSEATVDEAHV